MNEFYFIDLSIAMLAIHIFLSSNKKRSRGFLLMLPEVPAVSV